MTTNKNQPATTVSLDTRISGDVNHGITLDLGQPVFQQVLAHLLQKDLRQAGVIALPGQSYAGLAALVLLDLALEKGWKVGLNAFQQSEIIANFDLMGWRHNEVRPRRVDQEKTDHPWLVLDCIEGEIPQGERAGVEEAFPDMEGYQMLPFLKGYHVEPTSYGENCNEVLAAIIAQVPREVRASQKLAMICSGSTLVAAPIATAIFGLTGVWPRLIRRNREGGAFVFQEVIDLQELRQHYTQLLSTWGALAADEENQVHRDLAAFLTEQQLRGPEVEAFLTLCAKKGLM